MPDITPIFLDTAYIYALINTRDAWHARALHWERRLAVERRRLVTTELIFTEIADGLAAIRFRASAERTIHLLQTSPLVEIVPASSDLFAAGLALYRNRADKDWGLTDCSSFVVMEERTLSDALTSDIHFRQAGFRPLLLDPAG